MPTSVNITYTSEGTDKCFDSYYMIMENSFANASLKKISIKYQKNYNNLWYDDSKWQDCWRNIYWIIFLDSGLPYFISCWYAVNTFLYCIKILSTRQALISLTFHAWEIFWIHMNILRIFCWLEHFFWTIS